VKIFHFSPLAFSATAERSPITPLATYFSKSKLMARFQSHRVVHFHKKEDVIGDLEVTDDVLDLLFFGRDNQAQIRPCWSGADFSFSVAGHLGRIRASAVKKVERVFFRPCRPNVKGPNRSIRHQAGLCGLTELGLSGREKD